MSIHDVLGSDGLFAQNLQNFKAREVQLLLAEKIQKTNRALRGKQLSVDTDIHRKRRDLGQW